jgi:hypothetical protein
MKRTKAERSGASHLTTISRGSQATARRLFLGPFNGLSAFVQLEIGNKKSCAGSGTAPRSRPGEGSIARGSDRTAWLLQRMDFVFHSMDFVHGVSAPFARTRGQGLLFSRLFAR